MSVKSFKRFLIFHFLCIPKRIYWSCLDRCSKYLSLYLL